MIFRNVIPDYDMKMRKADQIVSKRAGDILNVFDFMPPADDPEEAHLIIKALRERHDGYIFIIEEEKKWVFPFNIKVVRAMKVNK